MKNNKQVIKLEKWVEKIYPLITNKFFEVVLVLSALIILKILGIYTITI